MNSLLSHGVVQLLLWSAVVSFLISVGPLVYLFIVRHRYWLKGHQTTSLAHELKSPLSTIIVAGEALLDFSKSPQLATNQQLAYLVIIERNVAKLRSFVNDLLTVVSIGAGHITLNKKIADLGPVVSAAVDDFSLLAEKKRISIRASIADVPSINLDAEKIQQVVANLLSNAVKFSDRGEIVVTLSHSKKEVSCSVADEGIGINRRDLERVFDRFFHTHASSKGSGMGLTIAKAWVEAHQGKIWATSAGPGKGSTLTFVLPLVVPAGIWTRFRTKITASL